MHIKLAKSLPLYKARFKPNSLFRLSTLRSSVVIAIALMLSDFLSCWCLRQTSRKRNFTSPYHDNVLNPFDAALKSVILSLDFTASKSSKTTSDEFSFNGSHSHSHVLPLNCKCSSTAVTMTSCDTLSWFFDTLIHFSLPLTSFLSSLGLKKILLSYFKVSLQDLHATIHRFDGKRPCLFH